MTIQWTLIAFFLYLELGLIILLILPFISTKIWKYVFQFPLWEAIGKKANTYFMIFLMVLVLFLLDSIREMIKYTGKHPHDYEAELQMNMKLFRAQRNYYIAGMALLLSFVIRRLILLILEESKLVVKNKEAMKKAQETTENLEKLMKEDQMLEEPKSQPNEKFSEEIKKLENLLQSTTNELKLAKQNLEDVQTRSTQLTEQYKELLVQVNDLKASAE